VLGYPLGRETGFLGFGLLPFVTAPVGALLGAVLPTWAVLHAGGWVRVFSSLPGLLCGALAGVGACKLLEVTDPLPYGIAASLGAGLGAAAVHLLRRT
jgi:hypothetical protein